MSQVLIQRMLVQRRWAEEERKFPIPDIEGPIPCDLYPGYFYIPWVSSRVVINKFGEMIKLLTGKKHQHHLNHRGYPRTSLRVGMAYQSIAVHRIVAMLFCPIPSRHEGLTFDDLEVNHKDGNITNNSHTNLEWVTGLENMRHAWATGLIATEKSVLARTTEGELLHYPSLSECARQHHLTTGALSKHLDSPYAGMIEADGCYFKRDDGSEWPDQWAVSDKAVRIGMNCDCVGENVETGQKLIFASLAQAADYLQIPIVPLRLSRSRKGFRIPYQGWVFYSLSGLPLSKKFKGDRHHSL